MAREGTDFNPGGGAGGSTVTWMVNGTLQSELVLKELE